MCTFQVLPTDPAGLLAYFPPPLPEARIEIKD